MHRLLPFVIVLAGCASTTGIQGTSPPTTVATTTTTVEPATTAGTTTTTEPRPEACDPIREEPLALGPIVEDGLFEVSGIARSELNPGLIWAHNDSGSPPRLWSVAADGSILGYLEIRARNVDWEDVAIAPGPDGVPWIHLADIGDNLGRRSQVWLHRFPEPAMTSGVVADVESLEIIYPDGPTDAEALIVDPITGDTFIITRAPSGRSTVLRVPVGAWLQDATVAESVATIDFGPLSFATAADISADGSIIAVRTYGDVWLWERDLGETVDQALGGPRCRAPAPGEPQGEAIALYEGGYITVSEGERPMVYRFITGG
jgi:hypothetical protein